MAKKKYRSMLTDAAEIETIHKKVKPDKVKHKTEEKKISYSVAEYLEGLGDIEFRFDVAADVRLTMNQARTVKEKLKHKRGFPDLTIYEPRGGYHGLILELKKDRNEVYTKKGKLKRRVNAAGKCHNQEQYDYLMRLSDRGYYTDYGFGLEDTIQKIKMYLNL